MTPQSASFDLLSTYAERLKSYKDGVAKSALQLKAIFLHLRSIEPLLSTIHIEYEGLGDSGQVEDINFYQSSGKLIESDSLCEADLPLKIYGKVGRQWNPATKQMDDLPPVAASVETAIDELAWDIAYGTNPGFEINEGGYGTIEVSVAEDGKNCNLDTVEVELIHNERIIQTNTESWNF